MTQEKKPMYAVVTFYEASKGIPMQISYVTSPHKTEAEVVREIYEQFCGVLKKEQEENSNE